MNNNPVGWFEIYVQDLDRAKNFYESVFQLKLPLISTSDAGTLVISLLLPLLKNLVCAEKSFTSTKGEPTR